jgi:hypothetical protein
MRHPAPAAKSGKCNPPQRAFLFFDSFIPEPIFRAGSCGFCRHPFSPQTFLMMAAKH